jgi:hypothetical protein
VLLRELDPSTREHAKQRIALALGDLSAFSEHDADGRCGYSGFSMGTPKKSARSATIGLASATPPGLH